MAKFQGFNPQGDWDNIPNKVFDEVMASIKTLTEMKLVLLFATGQPFFTTKELIRKTGQTDISIYRYLNKWQKARLIRKVNIAPAIKHANGPGKCATCGIEYPFLDEHHIVPLSENGPDTPENRARLCPNCHRLMHYKPWELTKAGRRWLGLERASNDPKDL